MNRDTSILIREVRANRFDPIKLRNARIGVVWCFAAVCGSLPLSLFLFGQAEPVLGTMASAFCLVSGGLFCTNRYRREWQANLKANAEQAAADAKRADEEGERIIAAELEFGKQEFSDLVDALCAVERAVKKPKRRRQAKKTEQLARAA